LEELGQVDTVDSYIVFKKKKRIENKTLNVKSEFEAN